MIELADLLEARAGGLAARAMEAMYADPFWDERFGERGRVRAAEDGRYHVTYLVEALRAASPDILANYARWLRTVLVTRGMCSRHLAENFARLGDAIASERIPGSASALEYLSAAQDALAYRDGPAGALEGATPELVRRTVASLAQEHPDRLDRRGDDRRTRRGDDLLYHLSYLADAVALGRSELFADYARWIAGFLARRGIPAAHLAGTLASLDAALESLAPEDRDAVRAALSAGRAALASSAA